MLGLVLLFTAALLKSSPAAEAVHPPPGSDDDAGAEEAVGLAQSGSPYCPLIFSIIVLIYCNRFLIIVASWLLEFGSWQWILIFVVDHEDQGVSLRTHVMAAYAFFKQAKSYQMPT